MHKLINTYLDQYLITDVVGRGSMSMVYKALQPSLNRHVAIKVLFGRLNPHSRIRFEQEARAVALLQHPNILPIYDFVQHDEIDYFVMQYVDPPVTLDNHIAGSPLPFVKSLHLISYVLDALSYAHSQGVIHRDIKPSNILMSREDWPLLADFGIAKMIDDSQQLTPVGQVVGTAAYMAPEVTRSNRVDLRSDIYSVGIVLYEMITGRVPFEGTNAIGVLMKHVNEPVPPPSDLNPTVPPPIEALVARALEKDPNNRYQNAVEMRAALHTALLQIERSSQQTSTTRPTPVFTPPLQTQPAVSLPAVETTPDLPVMPVSVAPVLSGQIQAPTQSRSRAFSLLVLAIIGVVAGLALWVFQSSRAPRTGEHATVATPVATREVATPAPTKGQPIPATPQVIPSSAPAEPTSGLPPESSLIPGTYVVQAGDTLTSIALRFSTTVDALLSANGLEDPNLIQEGQTLIIPDGTILLPTAHIQAPPTPLPSPQPAPTQQVEPSSGVVARFEDADWQGGYRRPLGRTYGGRSATWIYGSSTEYATMRTVFTLSESVNGETVLRVEGMDSEGPAKTPIQIDINGNIIYSGDNPLPDDDAPLETGTWGTYDFEFDPILLKQGENEIRITNLAPGAFSRPPFFMLDYAELVFTP
jgi:serine/threonine-protein kinase